MFNKYVYKSVIYCMQIHMKQWIFCIVTYSDAEIPLGMGSHALLHLWTWTLIAVVTEKNRTDLSITSPTIMPLLFQRNRNIYSVTNKPTYCRVERNQQTAVLQNST